MKKTKILIAHLLQPDAKKYENNFYESDTTLMTVPSVGEYVSYGEISGQVKIVEHKLDENLIQIALSGFGPKAW